MPGPDFKETVLEASAPRSLVWANESLVDWASGGTVYRLDGSRSESDFSLAYPFDAAVATSNGEFAVAYSRTGTKGALLRNGKFLRELNRSFYHADAYEYPICFIERPGRTLLAHCPEEYNRLQLEDAGTGERLTARSSKPSDFFHSRLAASRDGRFLISAGWVWHPWEAVTYFDVDALLRDPALLDSLDHGLPTSRNVSHAEEASACWQTETTMIVTASSEADDPDELGPTTPRLRPNGVVVYDLQAQTLVSDCVLSTPAGTVMPIGTTHAVAFYQHPRLIRLSDGFTELELPHLASGIQLGSIIHSRHPPALALDVSNARFAIAQADGIHVVRVRLAGDL